MDEFDRELNMPPAQRWEHDPNPLVGELISRYPFEGDYEPAEMLVILPEGSEVAYSVLCGRATLRSFVEQKDPWVGRHCRRQVRRHDRLAAERERVLPLQRGVSPTDAGVAG